jgi:hypothetical protein
LRLRRPVSTRKALKCLWMSYAAMHASSDSSLAVQWARARGCWLARRGLSGGCSQQAAAELQGRRWWRGEASAVDSNTNNIINGRERCCQAEQRCAVRSSASAVLSVRCVPLVGLREQAGAAVEGDLGRARPASINRLDITLLPLLGKCTLSISLRRCRNVG